MYRAAFHDPNPGERASFGGDEVSTGGVRKNGVEYNILLFRSMYAILTCLGN